MNRYIKTIINPALGRAVRPVPATSEATRFWSTDDVARPVVGVGMGPDALVEILDRAAFEFSIQEVADRLTLLHGADLKVVKLWGVDRIPR